MTSISPGSQLGPYYIEQLIGKGGMGEVYRANDTRLHRQVALKVLAPEFSTDRERLARFEQEARTTALLNHPNVIAVYDVGRHLGMPFVVSELLHGETLRQRLARGQLVVATAVAYAIELARGLVAAHQVHVVHRDLKPENIFLTHDQRVKILDFGLATCREKTLAAAGPDSATTIGRSGMVGTIGYAAPEQIRGEPADERADIFSLGVVLYEMIAGASPFHGRSPMDTVIAILNVTPVALGRLRAVPRFLEDVVHHCLEKHASQRYQSVQDLAFDLAAVLRLLNEPRVPPLRRLATLFGLI